MNAVLDKIWIDNLACEACATTIRQALANLMGVLNVRVNIADKWIEVEHEDFTDLETIETRLAQIGYRVAGATTPAPVYELLEGKEDDTPQQWML